MFPLGTLQCKCSLTARKCQTRYADMAFARRKWTVSPFQDYFSLTVRKCQTRCADLAKRACTLIPCHLFSMFLFTVVQEKPKCYQTNQNMENTYHSEMFFLTWENYQLFLMNAPLWIIVFQKAFEATLHFVFSIDSANQHFSWLPLFHLLLNLVNIWIVPQPHIS